MPSLKSLKKKGSVYNTIFIKIYIIYRLLCILYVLVKNVPSCFECIVCRLFIKFHSWGLIIISNTIKYFLCDLIFL